MTSSEKILTSVLNQGEQSVADAGSNTRPVVGEIIPNYNVTTIICPLCISQRRIIQISLGAMFLKNDSSFVIRGS